MALKDYNPFAKREEFSGKSLWAYKIWTVITWLLVVIVGIYHTFAGPPDCRKKAHCSTIWRQNSHYDTPFSLNSIVVSIYWVITLLLQGNYVRYLWHADKTFVNGAANVGTHFIFNNLLIFGFIMLWVRDFLIPAELLMVVNFFNLTSLYLRHPTTPRLIHIPVVSAPYAWTLVGILWTGAAMVQARNLPARILANIFIWVILIEGAFFLAVFKDYTMGFALSFLTLGLALGQFFTKVIALQWIFAFVIFGVLFVGSLIIGVPGLFGEGTAIRREGAVVSEDRERQPLLQDN